MWTQVNNQVIATVDQQALELAKVTRKLFAGKCVQLADQQGLPADDFVNLAETSAKLQGLSQQLKSMFVDRDEFIDAIMLGFASGEHVFVKSPPGTAKTDIMTQASKAINGKIFDVLFNQDLDRNSLYGPIDTVAYDKLGEWKRKWAALATCHIANLDEVWKGSGQNNNLLLNALNERVAMEGDEKISIPLHVAVAASNEIPEDDERQAIYDRFMIRLTLDYITSADFFGQMLVADGSTTEIVANIDTDELTLMAAASELMALTPPQELLDNVTQLWRELSTAHNLISDRRWRKTLKLACAQALLHNQQPNGSHISIAKWSLWQEEDEITSIKKLVATMADPLAAVILDIEAKLSDLLKALPKIAKEQDVATQMQMRADTASKSGKLGKEIKALQSQNGSGQHAQRLTQLFEDVQDLQLEIFAI